MSYTRSRGSSSYTTKTRAKREEIELEEGIPKCSGHNRRCKEFTAGQNTKNPGRKFYTCPLGQSDPQRCKFFKWADEIAGNTVQPSTGGQVLGGGQTLGAASAASVNGIRQNAQTLGQSPQSLYGKSTTSTSTSTTPTANRVANFPVTPQTGRRNIPLRRSHSEEEDDEIDWEKVDTDSLERDAIASTPGSSQRLSQRGPSVTPTLQEKLALASDDITPGKVGGMGQSEKRKREGDDPDVTPKRAVRDPTDNPFLSPGNLSSPPHHALSPAMESFEQLSAHLHRQDRLVRAGEAAKEGFRKTIQKQKARIEELEARVRELEAERGA